MYETIYALFLSNIGKSNLEPGTTLRILLVGQADMRHVFKTVGDNLELLKEKKIRIDVSQLIC